MRNDNHRPVPAHSRQLSEREIARRQNKRRKARRRRVMRVRAVTAALLGVVLIVILMFFTPLFNIRGVEISGNEAVSTEQIDAAIGSVEGVNLFKVNCSQIEDRIKETAYISEAKVGRKLIPPMLTVSVTESLPSGYFDHNGQYVVVDEECNILTTEEQKPSKIPEIAGFTGYTDGQPLPEENSERIAAASEFMRCMNELGLLDKVDILSLDPITSITFTYDGRLEVLCGSSLDLELKLKMFKENIYSSALNERSRGTIDLSVTGKAVYAPYSQN